MASYDDIKAALKDQLEVFVAGIAELDPEGPTDCEGWTVADLDNHMANNLKGLAAVAERKVDAVADGGVAYWSDQLEGFAITADEIARGGRLRTEDFVRPALDALEAYPEDTVVHQATGNHSLADAATFRVIEAVVHGLDVGIEPHANALKLVVKQLTRAFADKHPGRSVEVRVPPYSAVQCLDGPRHTRGTPPNVVEAQPIAWVRLVTGRETWTDLVRTGRVTASGERSDLSGLLPFIG